MGEILNFRMAVARPDSIQAYSQHPGMSWEDRNHAALLAHLGLWNNAEIARAFDTTRYSVKRAKNHFIPVIRS